MNTKQMQEQDRQYVANTYARFPVCIEKGKGAVCRDTDGKEYIDFTSGIGVNSLGFCEDGWVDAVCRQAGRLNHTSNLYYTQPNIELAKILCEETGMDKVFFANSGAEANEGAVKAARKYSSDMYGHGRSKIISLVNSFHGRTVTMLSATGQSHYHHHFSPFTEGFVHVEAGNIRYLEEQLDGTVCAVLVELIQGEGGVINMDKDYIRQVADLCRREDILLLIDEVQTGIGRTGTLFCYMQYGISPDIVTSAKGLGGGLPIGAFLMNKKTGGVLQAGDHGTTYGGNPIACAGAVEVLKIVKEKEFLETVTIKGRKICDELQKLEEVLEIEGMGLMLGITLKSKQASDIVKACIQNGLLVLTAKDRIRLLPPLNIRQKELEMGLGILVNAITA